MKIISCPLGGGVKSRSNIKSRDMLKDHVALLLHGRVTLEPSKIRKRISCRADKNGRENITHRAQIFVMHDFKKFSLNTFDTLKRSKGAQILRLIMTIDLN